jgi:hypothetical protein
MNDDEIETKQERREKKLQKKRERMAKHGKSIARVYMDAIMKRLSMKRFRGKKKGKEEGEIKRRAT